MIQQIDLPLIRKTINKTFDNLEYKTNNILQNFSDYPIYLYHRTNHHKNVGNILLKKKLIPSCLLTKKETYCATMGFNFVSLTEGKCILTGGNIQIVFDSQKLLSKNNIEPIFRKKNYDDLFLFELEWRSEGIVNFDYDDIKEIVLYKNYNPIYINIPTEKRRLTISQNYIQNLTKKLDIKFRVVDYESIECDKKERLSELERILGRDMFNKHMKSLSER